MDSCEFSGGDSSSVTVEGAPVSERNWAFKHLVALAKTFTMMTSNNGSTEISNQGGKDSVCAGSHVNTPLEGVNTMEDWNKQEVDWEANWAKQKGGDSLLSSQDGTMIEEDGMETSSESSEEDDEQAGEKNTGLKLSYDQHGLAHLSKADTPDSSAFPALLSLSAELQRDAEARDLAASIQAACCGTVCCAMEKVVCTCAIMVKLDWRPMCSEGSTMQCAASRMPKCVKPAS